MHGVSALAQFKEAHEEVDFSNYTSVRNVFSGTSFELGSSGVDAWRVSALIDWSDAAVSARVGFGSMPVFSYISGVVAVVTFPGNMLSIDPTIVAQASNPSTYAGGFERHSFFDGSNYWVFYYNGSATVYKHSNDSITWNTPATLLWPYFTAILYTSGTVYAVGGVTTIQHNVTLYFRKGMVSSNSINWSPTVIADTESYASGCYSGASYGGEFNLVVGSDGLITIAYTVRTQQGKYDRFTGDCNLDGMRYLTVRKSLNSDGTSWGSPTVVMSNGANYQVAYSVILSPRPSGVVLGIFDDGATGAITYSLSTAWTSLTGLDTAPTYLWEFGSAVTNSSNVISFVYAYQSTVRYRSYNGAWSSPVTIGGCTSGVSSPSISLDSSNDLNVFFICASPNYVYYVPYSVFSGWGTQSYPFGNTFNAPQDLSTESNSTSGYLFAMWREGTSIKLGSFPAQQVWSPYSTPSAPWDEEGLVPYGHYFKNLQEYVSPYSGLLTVIQNDFSIPGRGSDAVDPLTVTRVFRTPYTFTSAYVLFGYENYPYANLGLGWSFNWPWIGTNYLHLGSGQGYKIVFVNNVFENHKGDQFKLLQNSNGTYTLYESSGDFYNFNSAKQLTTIIDPTHSNQITFTYSSNHISQITDTAGRTINISYDSSSRVSTINTGGRIWTYTYDSNGNLISLKDPLNRLTSYQYLNYPNNQLLYKITYPTSAFTNFTYYHSHVGTDLLTYLVGNQSVYLSSSSLVKQIRYNYTSAQTKLTYWNGTAIQGYLIYSFTPVNATLLTENAQAQAIWKTLDQYNANGQISQRITYPGASTVSYTNYFGYDNWGNAVYSRNSITSNSYSETYYSYSNTNSQNRFVDFNGNNVTSFSNSFYSNSMDANIHDRLVGYAEFQNGIGSNKIESYYQYDYHGNRLQEKNFLLPSNWITTSYTYDSYGNMLTATDARGNQTTYQYSPTYQSAYLTQSSNVVSGLTLSTQYAYNFTTGDRIEVTSPSGNVTDYGYDMIDRLISITYPSIAGVRAQRRTIYDDTNNIVTLYDEKSNYTKNYYDRLGRLTQTQSYANGTAYSNTTSTYYWNDKLKSYTDPTGNITTTTYDLLGRKLTLTQSDGTYAHWNYNDQVNVVTAYDPKGHSTDYYHDWLNRLVRVTEHSNSQNFTTTCTFDTVGNLIQSTDSKNQSTLYSYDNLNRLIQTNFPDTTSESLTYDYVGNVVSRLTQNATTILYGYDQINRLAKITYPDGSTVTYVYDKDSNRLQMVDPSSTTTYTYDPRARLLSESRKINGQTYTLSHKYDAASNLIQLTYPDGYVINYAYDALNRIISIGNLATMRYRKNSQLATVGYGNGVQTAYSYDQLGRTTRIRTWNTTMTLLDLNYAYDANGNPISLNSGQETYTYDALNRLTNATGPFGTLSYSYDGVGNRVNAVVNGTGTNYNYGTYNKLLSSSGSATINYGYDKNGNLIEKWSGSALWNYTYDYESRLKQVKLNGQSVFQSIYDGDGRRIEIITSNTLIFHYEAGSWDPAYMKNVTSGIVTDVVFAGSYRMGEVRSGVNYYSHLDRLGSVRLVTKSGNIQTFITKYLPYGIPYATSGVETFQYTGKTLDVATGLYYYGNRYYDSQSGRFVTPDPSGPNYQNPQSIDRYVYALDNPNAYTDPTGLYIYTGSSEGTDWYRDEESGTIHSGKWRNIGSKSPSSENSSAKWLTNALRARSIAIGMMMFRANQPTLAQLQRRQQNLRGEVSLDVSPEQAALIQDAALSSTSTMTTTTHTMTLTSQTMTTESIQYGFVNGQFVAPPPGSLCPSPQNAQIMRAAEILSLLGDVVSMEPLALTIDIITHYMGTYSDYSNGCPVQWGPEFPW